MRYDMNDNQLTDIISYHIEFVSLTHIWKSPETYGKNANVYDYGTTLKASMMAFTRGPN